MKQTKDNFQNNAFNYLDQLRSCFTESNISLIKELSDNLLDAWINENNVFICGNGGSAANASHLANDFNYGIGSAKQGKQIPGMKVEALGSNIAITTCLANDIGYQNIYSNQLLVKGNKNDLLIALSGSGNSPNILNAIETGNQLGIKTFAILGFDGGKAKDLARFPIHFNINDMQISEDIQLLVGHICMQWLYKNKPDKGKIINRISLFNNSLFK
tara:strand:+ start:821 stop:1468 length:648 start_codon:yes stop_codon:yes gene_type:complete